MRARQPFDRTEVVLSSIPIPPPHAVAWRCNSVNGCTKRRLECGAVRIHGLVPLGVAPKVRLEDAGRTDRDADEDRTDRALAPDQPLATIVSSLATGFF